jgi:hypothetical protein
MIDETLPAAPSSRSFFRDTITYSTFYGQYFLEADFRRVEARLSSFEGCVFKDCRFSNANFTYARFIGCTFVYTDDSEVSDASLGGAQFEDCEIATQGRLRFKHCNLRDVCFTDCLIGAVDFTSNGLEDSLFSGCSFSEIDIRSVATTALTFLNCRFEKVQVSVENFVSIIGAPELLENTKAFILSRTVGGGTIRLASDRHDVVALIEDYVDEKKLDTFQKLNSAIQLALIENHQFMDRDLLKFSAIIDQLRGENPLIAFDQISNIVRLISLYGMQDAVRTEPLQELFVRFDEYSDTLPQSLSVRVAAARRRLFNNEHGDYVITFRFAKADPDNFEDRRLCYEFVYALRHWTGAESAAGLRPGSFELLEFVKKKDLKLWLVALIVLVPNVSLNVNINLTDLSEKLVAEAAERQSETKAGEMEKIQETANALALSVTMEQCGDASRRSLDAEELRKALEGGDGSYDGHRSLPVAPEP